jgi:cell wall-associated NlpC family hydrolase
MKARGLVLVLTMAACQTEAPEAGSDLPEGQVQATLMASQSGIRYADLDMPEALPWGPPGIFSVKDGYAIPDNVRGKITLLNRDFGMAREIDLQGQAQGVLAVAQDGNDLVALDGTAVKPKLLRIDADGHIKTLEIPLDTQIGPSGLSRDDRGLILEYGGGETLYRVSDQGGSMGMEPTDSYVWNGHTYSLDHPKTAYFHERKLSIDGSSIMIRVPNHLGAARLLGPDADGGVRVLVEDVKVSPVVTVEQTVWHIALSGEVLSVAQVPLDKRLLTVESGVALDASGEPVAIVPQRGALQFWRLAPTGSAAVSGRQMNLLPDEAAPKLGVATQGLITAGSGCLTSAQMESNALEYLNTSTFISTTSIVNDATCVNTQVVRTIPHYLLTSTGTARPEYYGSVSYAWGKWETPAQFIAAMSANHKAGNITDSKPDGSIAPTMFCAYGTDCSGFVGRVWGLTVADKPGTTTLVNFGKSTPVTLVTGDALVYPGHHAIIFRSNGTNGILTYESTADQNYDRVIIDFRSWSDLSTYRLYRSQTSCF